MKRKQLFDFTSRQFISINIRALMDRDGMSPQSFTDAVNEKIEKLVSEKEIKPRENKISRNQLWKYYKKDSPRKPRRDTMLAICEVFGVTPEALTSHLIIDPLQKLVNENNSFTYDRDRLREVEDYLEELNKVKSRIEVLMNQYLSDIDLLTTEYKNVVSGNYLLSDSIVSKRAFDYSQKVGQSSKKMLKEHDIRLEDDSKESTPERKKFKEIVARAEKSIDYDNLNAWQVRSFGLYKRKIRDVISNFDKISSNTPRLYVENSVEEPKFEELQVY